MSTINKTTTQRWEVYTMTHDDELYDPDTWEPIDDFELAEWAVGFEVDYSEPRLHVARSAGLIAENMTWGVANYIADLHNATLGAP